MLRDVYAANPDDLPAVLPDETNSNRLGDVFDRSDRAFMERTGDRRRRAVPRTAG